MLIAPAQITLTAYDSCRFRLLNDKGEDVSATWDIKPSDVGSIASATGAYTAPRWIWFTRSVVVCARIKGADDQDQLFFADVKLSNVRALSWSLFLFLAAVATALVFFLLGIAPHESHGSRFEIAPREVVLTYGQQQQFSADGDVKWSPNAPGGLFTAPANPQGGTASTASTASAAGSAGAAGTAASAGGTGGAAKVEGAGGSGGSIAGAAGSAAAGAAAVAKAGGGATEFEVFATNKVEADWVSSAKVKLDSQHHLRIEPARPQLAPGETLQLHPETDLAREQVVFEPAVDGLCNEQGLCVSKSAQWTDRVVPVNAKSRDGSLRATVNVRFLGTRSDLLSPILVALLFGALGGLLHAINSLIGYVGNDKFVGRWSFYYLARPFIGAAVGLIVMLVFKGNLAADTLKDGGFYSLAAVAALAGLFSDPATHKLKEIFDVVLGPKRDDRTNTMEGAAPRPPAPPAPTIIKVTPSEVDVGSAATVVVTGSNFSSQSRAQIDKKDRKTTFDTATQLRVQLEPEDVDRVRSLALIITDGTATSTAQTINVKAPAGGGAPAPAPAKPPAPATPPPPVTPAGGGAVPQPKPQPAPAKPPLETNGPKPPEDDV